MTINCKYCGKFTSNDEYCSRSCVGKDMQKQVERECITCGNTFERVRSEVERYGGRYCSRKCATEDQKNRVSLTCDNCGEQFERHWSDAQKTEGDYCSQQCAAEARRIPEALRVEDDYGPLWRERRWEALQRDNFECQDCGMTMRECRGQYEVGLHVHHIVPYREFDSDEEAHKLDNLETLCPQCHADAERKA